MDYRIPQRMGEGEKRLENYAKPEEGEEEAKKEQKADSRYRKDRPK